MLIRRAKLLQESAAPLLIFAGLCGCGENAFKSGERKEPAEDATLALERGEEDAAINILENALLEDPGNGAYLSILATAHAQRAGVEPLHFAANVVSKDSSSTGGMTALFGLIPEASSANLADIDAAVTILAADIPPDRHQPGDTFKYAIYQTASMLLHTKALDKNGDGILSVDELLNLSDASAVSLLTQLASAKGVLGGDSASNDTSEKAAAAITSYQAQIDAAPGETDAEKLRNYLATRPTSTK